MTSSLRMAVFCCFVSLLTAAVFAQEPISVGANVNMVSGQSFPNGDPFQRQQNEPSVAFSSRNNLHLLAGANDYRAVDVPGLPGGRETGDSWLSYFWSTNGGATWESTLIPGYPQDPACLTSNPPALCGYAAGADPVVRAGVNGMFYYSGIVFERSDPSRSAIFVSRFIDLNNDEGGDPIRFLDTTIIDANNDGEEFLDKSWIGVDIPRNTTGTPPLSDTFAVIQSDGTSVNQTVGCGSIYVGYAAISGEDADLRSEIRLARSSDCGNNWDIQNISQPDSLNQGANISINPGTGALDVVWRRFDTVESFLGVSPAGCPARPLRWRFTRHWPVSTVTLGDQTYTTRQARHLLGYTRWFDESYRVANVLIAAKLNVLTGGGDPVPGFNPWHWAQDMTNLIAEADAWLLENPLGSRPRGHDRWEGKKIKRKLWRILQGSGSCEDNGIVRNSMETGQSNAIMVASSSDFGETFGEPVVVSESSTFDQGSTSFSFRTTAYPTVATDSDGRIYVAWAARGFATIRGSVTGGDARIVMSTSTDGTNWSPPYAIDEPNRQGHQIKPSILFAGGQLTLVFYDFRQDVSNIFEDFVVDLPEDGRLRHTVDVRVATAVPDIAPVFTDYSVLSSTEPEPVNPSSSASRYTFVASGTEFGGETLQVEYMVPNFPMFADGTTPFIGDYVDIAAPNLIKDGDTWRFASNPGDVQVWQAVWSDNRDVIPPPDGDWSKYVAPITVAQPSVFDPTVVIPSCTDVFFPDAIPEFQAGALYTGTRNQNVYSATISNGVIVAAPGNNRPLGFDDITGAPLERGFVVYVQNTTGQTRQFRVSLPDTPLGVQASLEKNQIVTQQDIEVPPFSSTVTTVFAVRDGTPVSETIPVSVVELGGTLAGTVLLNSDDGAPGPLETSLETREVYNPAILNPAILNPAILNLSVDSAAMMSCTDDPAKCVLNPAILNPAIFNPAILNPAIFNPAILNPAILNPAIFNPAIFNPAIFNPAILNPAIMNPAILNPAILNPAIFNPAIFNPAILNPAILNPAILNPAILNPAILNPAILNPAILNPAILNPAILNPAILNSAPGATPQQVDVTFAIRNDGNATTAYDLNLAGPEFEGLDYDLLVYRLNETPVAQGCDLVTEAQQQLIFNQNDPLNTGIDGSFYLEPGEEVFVTFRVLPDVTAPTPADPTDPMNFNSDDLFGQVSAQSPNTDPTTQPPADQFGPPASCDIAGNWLGTYVQPGFGSYPMILTNLQCGAPGSVIAQIEYPTLGCSGDWTLDNVLGERLLVTETVSGGFCVPVVEHELLGVSGGTLSGVTPDFNSTFSLTQTGVNAFVETVITGDSSILSDGFLVAANNLGLPANAVAVNGINFGTSQAGLSGSWQPGDFGDFSLDAFSADLDGLLSVLQFSNTLSPATLTIGGLTAGTDYRLQLLFSNDVNTTGDRVEVTVEGETWVLDDWQPNAINLTANFTATGPTVEVTIAPGAGSTPTSGRAVLNAYVIHAEPFVATSLGSVDNVSLASTTVTIGGVSPSYTADLSNNTAATLSPVVFQAYVDQPNASRAAGGFVVNCNSAPGVPPGGCSIGGSLNVGNPMAAGTGTLVPGPATARFELVLGPNSIGPVIDRFTVPITLTDPVSPVTINSVSPSINGAGDGFMVVRGVNFPDPGSAVLTVTSGGTSSPASIFQSPSTASTYYARIPGSFPPGSASIVITGGTAPSNAFPITVSATPGAPIITDILLESNQVSTPSAIPGTAILIIADGTDTLGAQVRFTQGANTTIVPSTRAVSNSTIGLGVEVTVPTGLLTSSTVDISVRQGSSDFSAPVTLVVPTP